MAVTYIAVGCCVILVPGGRGGGEGVPYNGIYREAPPKRGTFFRLQENERVGTSKAEVYERAGICHLGL